LKRQIIGAAFIGAAFATVLGMGFPLFLGYLLASIGLVVALALTTEVRFDMTLLVGAVAIITAVTVSPPLDQLRASRVFMSVLLVDGLLPLAYVIQIGWAAAQAEGAPADERSRTDYLDSLKTVVTAAGVALAVVGVGLQGHLNAPTVILRYGAGCLIACVLFSVAAILEMSRVYEGARLAGGSVLLRQLIIALFLGYAALMTFLVGFSYLAWLILSA
jgi:hypothetical protein